MKARHPASIYLGQYGEIKSRCDLLKEQLNELRQRAAGAGIRISEARTSPSFRQDRMAESAVRIADTERHLQDMISNLAECLDMRLWLIEQLDDETEKLLLTMRYIKGMGWVEISMKMHYGESRTYEIHKSALDHLWEKKGE